MPEDFAIGLFDPNGEVFSPVAPVGVAHPNFVRAAAWDFDVLPDARPRLVRARSDGVPLALAALRPLGRNSGSVNSPTARLPRRQFQIRGIQEGFMARRLGNPAHVLSLIPQI